jgi:hypothetical protein
MGQIDRRGRRVALIFAIALCVTYSWILIGGGHAGFTLAVLVFMTVTRQIWAAEGAIAAVGMALLIVVPFLRNSKLHLLCTIAGIALQAASLLMIRANIDLALNKHYDTQLIPWAIVATSALMTTIKRCRSNAQ